MLKSGGHARLLLLFPQREDLLQMECRVESLGYDIYGTTTWDEARSILLAEEVHILVVPFDFPGVTRLEVLGWIEAEKLPTQVLFLHDLEDTRITCQAVRLFPRASVLDRDQVPFLRWKLRKLIQESHLPVRPFPQLRLGQILARLGRLDSRILERCLELQQDEFPETRPRLGQILVQEGVVDAQTLDAALRLQAA